MPETETIKQCPKCGTSFTCTPIDCWCSKLPNIMPIDENAACYCPECLGAIISGIVAQKLN